jgi:hypothetical protein
VKYGKITPNPSFGLVIANTEYAGRYETIWDDPYAMLTGGLVIGWGPDWLKYAANALRKLRPAARLSRNKCDIAAETPELFIDVVPSTGADPLDLYPWGDFPYGGGIIENVDRGYGAQVLMAASALTPQEDEMISLIAADFSYGSVC